MIVNKRGKTRPWLSGLQATLKYPLKYPQNIPHVALHPHYSSYSFSAAHCDRCVCTGPQHGHFAWTWIAPQVCQEHRENHKSARKYLVSLGHEANLVYSSRWKWSLQQNLQRHKGRCRSARSTALPTRVRLLMFFTSSQFQFRHRALRKHALWNPHSK